MPYVSQSRNRYQHSFIKTQKNKPISESLIFLTELTVVLVRISKRGMRNISLPRCILSVLSLSCQIVDQSHPRKEKLSFRIRPERCSLALLSNCVISCCSKRKSQINLSSAREVRTGFFCVLVTCLQLRKGILTNKLKFVQKKSFYMYSTVCPNPMRI